MPTPKEIYSDRTRQIRDYHRSGESGFAVASRLTAALDEVIQALWLAHAEELRSICTVMALGGYGRCEVCPHSDVDLMLLFSNEQNRLRGAGDAERFLHALWDTGFDLGHSVRTIEDCVALSVSDVDSWASVLESRYICGSAELLTDFSSAVIEEIKRRPNAEFVAAVLHGARERHEKYGNAVKLLEPNIKNSAGGLRDLHTLLWMFRASAADFFPPEPFRSTESACRQMLQHLADSGLATSEECRAAVDAMDFLLRARHETHYHANANHDTLDFSMQRHIAAGLGYGDDPHLQYVERFMRAYYIHARNVYRLNRRLMRLHQKQLHHSMKETTDDQILDEVFLLRGPALSFHNRSFSFTSRAQLLHAFTLCGRYGVDPGQSLQSKFIQSTQAGGLFSATDGEDEAAAAEFRAIIQMRSRVAATLMLMNDFDVLGALIPEWRRLVAFFQHSQYHYYTADAHTLIAMEHAENLEDKPGVLGDVYRSLPRRDLLFLAILLHDIEKPNGVDRHEIRGAETSGAIMARFGIHDDGTVPFLIRHHLTMEQIAFRRNINDPKTIADFSQLFTSPEQLDYLLLLTFSDLSAVNKSVWTSWKEMLLRELYLRTRAVLERNLSYGEALSFQQSEYSRAVQRLLDGFREHPLYAAMERHLTLLHSDAYVALFTGREIESHLLAAESLDVVTALLDHTDSHSTLTVVTRDAPFLLSHLCGVLSANDANIFDAHIFTRTDGIVLDQFRVTDVATKKRLSDAQTAKIVSDFENVLRGTETLETLFERHQRRWKRRPQPLLHPNIKRDVEFEASDDFTIIDVYAADTTGFLYRITRTISELELDIYFAKIATRVDGIVDSFYVLERGRVPVPGEERRQHIRACLLDTIRQMEDVQLST